MRNINHLGIFFLRAIAIFLLGTQLFFSFSLDPDNSRLKKLKYLSNNIFGVGGHYVFHTEYMKWKGELYYFKVQTSDNEYQLESYFPFGLYPRLGSLSTLTSYYLGHEEPLQNLKKNLYSVIKEKEQNDFNIGFYKRNVRFGSSGVVINDKNVFKYYGD